MPFNKIIEWLKKEEGLGIEQADCAIKWQNQLKLIKPQKVQLKTTLL